MNTRISLSLASLIVLTTIVPAPAETPEKRKRPEMPAEIATRYADTVEIRRDLPYAGNTNPRQMVDVYLPKKRTSDRPLPVVAFVHGGGWGGGNRQFFTERACDLAASGEYVAVGVGYRLTNEAHWPAQIHDCKAAIRWIRGHAQELNIDTNRIGAFGGSAGGMLVSLLGTSGNVTTLDGNLGPFTNLSSRVACVVNICGPCDLTVPLCTGRMAVSISSNVTSLLGGPLPDKLDVAREASPLTYISKDTPPILTIHGKHDSLVDFQHSVRFDAALKQAGASSLLVPLEGVDHNFAAGQEPLRRIRQFLDLHLRGIPAEISTAIIPRAEAVASQ